MPMPEKPQPAPHPGHHHRPLNIAVVPAPGEAWVSPGEASPLRPPGHARLGEDGAMLLKWFKPLLLSCCADPGFFTFACCCPFHASYQQRKKLLKNDMTKYECCAGIMAMAAVRPDWMSPKAGDDKKTPGQLKNCVKGREECCLWMEVCCCLGCSVHGNRWMVQHHYGLENTYCDVCLMSVEYVCGILTCLTKGEEGLQNFADFMYCPVTGCMLTQNEIQMKQLGYPKKRVVIPNNMS